MSLTRMRTFIEVYRQCSISGAARALNLTQPAVSQHIAGLEVAVGRPLFERSPTGVTPTAAAEALAMDIGDKLDAAEAALASARARSMDISGVLQLVGHADVMAEILGQRLLPLLEAGVRVRLHSGGGDMVTSMLLEGHCDLGISAHPVVDGRLKSEPLFTSRVLPVAAPAVAARLAASDDFAGDIRETPLLAYDLELSMIERWLQKNRIGADDLVPYVVNQDLRAQRQLLMQGFGWSVMPEYLCRQQMARGELAEIASPVGTHEIHYYLVWRPQALRQARVAHARQTLLQQLRLPE
ncbi:MULTISPECIES: LysR family transcriptional regulator [Halomonas]|uniref:LysR family transcriptional regulator n=1 Tax=Halomonas TaxID=2745 RepID=UPI00030A73BB|nr:MULTISPECIES: LysR family transcriptional regulator [Halomonas]QFT83853.1 Hca operon transcriptional activator [Halomonas sp. THAF12]